MKSGLKVGLIIMAVAVMAMALAGTLYAPQAVQAQSGGVPSGLAGRGNVETLLGGTTGYTTAVIYSGAIDARAWGSVQVMAAAQMTSTYTLTVTPQFSLQNLPCGSVTQWFTSTSYLPYQPYSVSSNSNTITETVGAWTYMAVNDAFTVSGSNVGMREVPGNGVCFRAMVEFSAPGKTYTPTLLFRGTNRN